MRIGSIKARLSLLIAGTALVLLFAAAGILMAVRTTNDAIARLSTSQQRLDLLTEISGRLTDYAFTAVEAPLPTAPSASRLAAMRESLERAIAAAGALDAPEAPQNSRVSLGRLRADFVTLDTTIKATVNRPDAGAVTDTIRGALNDFALRAAPQLATQIEAGRRAVQEGREDISQKLNRLIWIASIAALLAIIAAFVLNRAITRPLLRRIRAIDTATKAIGGGRLDTRLAIGAHDELGLLIARLNRMAASLSRRESRLSTDRAMLGRTVEEKTAELTAANRRLAAVDLSRRRFFADVSHELRTPLTVILGECDISLRGGAISDTQIRAVLDTIRHRAKRLHRRVEDLLRVARSENGEIALDFQHVAVQGVLEDVVQNYAAVARRHNLELELVPPTGPGDLVADGEWIRQVIEGLVDNAIRHAKGATGIRTSLVDGPDSVTIKVIDDGMGISETLRQQVFERFKRRDEEEASGFGIGLALARWIITQHHGTIDIVQNEDFQRGTQIQIILPKEFDGDGNIGRLQ